MINQTKTTQTLSATSIFLFLGAVNALVAMYLHYQDNTGAGIVGTASVVCFIVSFFTAYSETQEIK